MTDTERSRSLEPVHAGEDGSRTGGWAYRLVIFLRVMAGLSMLKGLYHWSVVLGMTGTAQGFEMEGTPYQVATVFFAVIDLVAAVGLWLMAPWGAVVWLTAVISMVAVQVLFPQIYGGNMFVVLVALMLMGAYLVLALMAAREQSA